MYSEKYCSSDVTFFVHYQRSRSTITYANLSLDEDGSGGGDDYHEKLKHKHTDYCVSYDGLKAVTMKFAVFWDVESCSLVVVTCV